MGETTIISQLLVFRLDDQRYALPLDRVQHIVRAAEITPLPKTPSIVIGVVNVGGTTLPVLNIRQRFRRHTREISPEEHFLIAQTIKRTVILQIDEAIGVIQIPSSEIESPGAIVPGIEHVKGVVQREDGIILIQDLDAFLSLDEECALDEAMSRGVTHGA